MNFAGCEPLAARNLFTCRPMMAFITGRRIRGPPVIREPRVPFGGILIFVALSFMTWETVPPAGMFLKPAAAFEKPQLNQSGAEHRRHPHGERRVWRLQHLGQIGEVHRSEE